MLRQEWLGDVAALVTATGAWGCAANGAGEAVVVQVATPPAAGRSEPSPLPRAAASSSGRGTGEHVDACASEEEELAARGVVFSSCVEDANYRAHWSITSTDDTSGHFEVLHVDAVGRELAVTLEALSPAKSDGSGHEIDVALQDFDTDGDPELVFVQEQSWLDDGFPGIILGARNGKLRVVYTPPAGYYVKSFSDVDADGRLDLLLQTVVGGDGDTGCGARAAAVWSPELVAHALPGGVFAMNDPVARDFAKRWCPSVPRAPQTSQDVLCAVLRDAGVEALSRRFERELDACYAARERRRKRERDTGCDADSCDDERDHLTEIAWKPPFTL